MFIKKFEAQSLEQALSLVKSELGPNALILSTQSVKGKWFNKPLVEVTAAYEKKGEGASAASPDTFTEEALLEVFPHRKRSRVAVDEEPIQSQNIRKTKANRYADFPAGPTKNQTSSEKTFEAMYLRAGLSPETAADLGKQINFDYPKKDLAVPSFLDKAMARSLVSSLSTFDPNIFEDRPRWAAVGTSGSGKTTALVKLALFLKGAGREVSLTSFDRQKLLGRRELLSYAKLIHVPFHDATVSEKAGTVELSDSPAFPLGDPASTSLKEIERACHGRSVCLVLDASLRLKEALRAVDAVSAKIPVTALAFTRLDVVSQHGIIFDVLRRTKLPLLGASISASFKTPFKFFESGELANFILRPKN